MAIPASRNDFIAKCLRNLGAPTINIELTPDQIDDSVDEALQYWWDNHYDGSSKVYYKYQITDTDKLNRYITLPSSMLGVVRLFSISDPSISSDSLFNIRYQIALNDLYTLTSDSIVPYFMAMQHLSLLTEVLVGQQPIRYNRHSQILYIDMDWDVINTGQFLLVEAYQQMDPDVNISVWNDRWLMKYATQLMKRRWGELLKKYSGTALPGGVMVNGQEIWSESTSEILRLESEMMEAYSAPLQFFTG